MQPELSQILIQIRNVVELPRRCLRSLNHRLKIPFRCASIEHTFSVRYASELVISTPRLTTISKISGSTIEKSRLGFQRRPHWVDFPLSQGRIRKPAYRVVQTKLQSYF